MTKNLTGSKNKFSPEEKREMKVEQVINRYRLGYTFLVIGIILLYVLTFKEFLTLSNANFFFLVIFLVLIPLVFIVHRITLKGSFTNWLKYLTVTIDMCIGMFVALPLLLYNQWLLPISKLEFTLLISFVFVLFNSLTVLRLNKNLVYYSAVLAVVFNIILYTLQNKLIFAGIFTTVFISLQSLFNTWVTNYLLDYYSVNNQLSLAFKELKVANENINQKNEEITAQSDQIIKHIETLESIQKDHTDSLIYAQKIQKALIDNELPFDKNFEDYFIYFRPKSLVTGDFYWISELDNKIVMAVSDCTGHGVPGAFMTMLGYSFLNEIVTKAGVTEPDKILNELREHIIFTLHQDGKIYEQKDGMDMAVIQLDKNSSRIKFSAANNSLCYIPVRKSVDDKKIYEFKGDRMPISFHYKMRHFSQLEFDVRKGDRFYLYTDGYIDQFGGPRGKKFKSVPFRRMLLRNHMLPMIEQRNILQKTMDEWLDNRYEQVDDITVIGLHF